MVDETLTYVLEAVDSVTPITDRIADSEDMVAASADKAQNAIDSQSLAFIKQMTVASGLHRGLGMLISSSKNLGIINEETAETFNKVNSAVGIVSGTFQTLKAAQQIVIALREAELGLAAVETFRSVLHNPAMMAVVGVGVGAAAGVGAMALAGNSSSSSNTTVNQTVVFGDSSSNQRSTARASFEAAGGF